MRRTDFEFKEEVLRRAQAYRQRRRKHAQIVAALCLPVILCGGGLLALYSAGSGGSTMSAAYDNAKSVECAEAPASPAPEAIEEEFAAQSAADMEPAANDYPASGELVMPEDFAIRFSWAIGAENIYDTYTGQIQKDLVLDGVASAEFEPDREVLEEIYRKLTELDLVSIDREMTSASLTTNGEMVAMTPLTVYEIQFTIDGSVCTITGDATASCYPEDNEAARFMEFVNYMHEILEQTPEYQHLPEPNGGYD